VINQSTFTLRSIFLTLASGLAILLTLSSCGSYRQNIMFKVPEGAALKNEIESAEKNYVIKSNDYLTLQVYTNEGERIIDPDFRLLKDMPSQSAGNSMRPDIQYLVNEDGLVKLPMIGQMKLEGLSLREAEQVLQKEYSKYYQNPFVYLQFQNKRVIVLGAPGGQVIPLINQSVTLVEVLALAKGVDNYAKANNIRVLRGDQVFVADFSTFDGYKKSNVVMEPGDVVYVEPIRRPLVEGLRDYGPIFTIMTSLTALVVVALGL
jgi:polysaccharide biosynthesis/export protein